MAIWISRSMRSAVWHCGIFWLCQVASGGGAVSAAWAWPMPAVQAAKLQQYEAGLKELLARHGLDGKQQVDSLSLTEAVVDVTTLLSVEFEVERERQERNLTAGLWHCP